MRSETATTAKIYLDYTQAELDRQYEHRHFVQNVEEYVTRAKAESRRVRAAAQGHFDVSYGPGEDEKLDIYTAASGSPAPVIVFFHGGRWSRGSKSSSCDAAEVFNAAGIHYVSVNYSLLPNVTMDVLIRQCRDSIVWAWRNCGMFDGDPDRLYVMGKSSGAHIAGMMVTTDWTVHGLPADVLKGGLLISGMYDLEPVRLTFRNEWLKLDRETAYANSPIHRIPDTGCPLVIGCGALETDEFRRQTKAFSQAWRAKGGACDTMEIAGGNHYSVSADMRDSPLVNAMFERIAVTGG